MVDAAGAEPLLREHEAVALVAEEVPERHARALVADLGVARPASAAWPMTEMLRRIEKPGVSVGTRIRLARRWGAASGSVTAMQTANAAPSAEDANHLWPRITQSPPSRFAVVPIQTGFEPANSGSVIVKQLRISPATSGRSQRSLWASVPCPRRSSMFPTSGACTLKA